MVKALFNNTIISQEKALKDTNGLLKEKTHDGKKYALVSVEDKSLWGFCLKALGLTIAAVYSLGLCFISKGFRNDLTDNWKATFSKDERKIEHYQLLETSENGNVAKKTEDVKTKTLALQNSKSTALNNSENLETPKNKTTSSSVDKVETPKNETAKSSSVDKVENKKENLEDLQFLWYVDKGKNLDMPYLEGFLQKQFPKFKLMPSDLTNSLEKVRRKEMDENDPTFTRFINSTENMVYFYSVNSRADLDMIQENFNILQKMTKKPVIFVLLANSTNWGPSESTDLRIRSDVGRYLGNDAKVIISYYDLKVNNTGLDDGELFILNPEKLAKDLNEAFSDANPKKYDHSPETEQSTDKPIVKGPSPTEKVQDTTTKNSTEFKYLWYGNKGAEDDMPYLTEFLKKTLPNYKKTPDQLTSIIEETSIEEIEKDHTFKEMRDSISNDNFIYFLTFNERLDHLEIKRKLTLLQEVTKRGGTLVVFANSSNRKPGVAEEESLRKELEVSFGKDVKIVVSFFDTKWDTTGFGENQLLIHDPTKLDADLKKAISESEDKEKSE